MIVLGLAAHVPVALRPVGHVTAGVIHDIAVGQVGVRLFHDDDRTVGQHSLVDVAFGEVGIRPGDHALVALEAEAEHVHVGTAVEAEGRFGVVAEEHGGFKLAGGEAQFAFEKGIDVAQLFPHLGAVLGEAVDGNGEVLTIQVLGQVGHIFIHVIGFGDEQLGRRGALDLAAVGETTDLDIAFQESRAHGFAQASHDGGVVGQVFHDPSADHGFFVEMLFQERGPKLSVNR